MLKARVHVAPRIQTSLFTRKSARRPSASRLVSNSSFTVCQLALPSFAVSTIRCREHRRLRKDRSPMRETFLRVGWVMQDARSFSRAMLMRTNHKWRMSWDAMRSVLRGISSFVIFSVRDDKLTLQLSVTSHVFYAKHFDGRVMSAKTQSSGEICARNALLFLLRECLICHLRAHKLQC